MEALKYSYNIVVSGKEENLKKLWMAFNNMDYYKRKYKNGFNCLNGFNYFFGLRNSWFSLIWLYWVENASSEENRGIAISIFNDHLRDKKFHKVYFKKMGGIYPYNPIFCYKESDNCSIIKVNIYEENKEYCLHKIREILKLFGLSMYIQQYKNEGHMDI